MNKIESINDIMLALNAIADDFNNAKSPIVKQMIIDKLILVFHPDLLTEKGLLEAHNDDPYGSTYYTYKTN